MINANIYTRYKHAEHKMLAYYNHTIVTLIYGKKPLKVKRPNAVSIDDYYACQDTPTQLNFAK